MKSKHLIIQILACACVISARADFNPVTLTANSYTFDIVVESNAVKALPYCINVTAGGGSGLSDNTYYEQGLHDRIGTTGGNSGVPRHNAIFTNINNVNMAFQMPPDYTTNNDLMVDSTHAGVFTFNTATTATNLAVLGCGGGGATVVAYAVTHADASVESGTISLLDWFGGGSTVAWGANGRITSAGVYNNYNASAVNNQAPYLYANTISVSGASPIVNVAFTFSSGQHANIFAVSGKDVGAAIWTPMSVGGFNVKGVVPATFPLTATMDQGTNNVNNANLATWFEIGYVSDTAQHITNGLPPSGSIFNSLSQPTHHYQMGNYSANNGILVDKAHPVVNITPAVTTNLFSTFALLTAGGTIGNGFKMTNLCILQHLDGVNETNLFYGYDWFETTVTPAFIANGRVNMYSRTVNQLNNNLPRLFETYFSLNDASSPVTNIMVLWQTSPQASSTTFIMAVSASAGGIPPLITSGPLPALQAWYPTQTATFNILVSGTAPLTNNWLVMKNGVYVPLTDGVDANGSTISGSGNQTLRIANLALADATNYEYIAANAFGSVTSSPAVLEISGRAGVIPMSGWNNIANTTYPIGSTTNIFASDGVTTSTLTITDNGSTNGFNTGIASDGANYSLMHGYMDTGSTVAGQDGIVTIGGLTDASYDVYIYCLGNTAYPNSATAGLPNYAVNGITNYAPALGSSVASTYTVNSNSVGGNGFNGFVQAATFPTNDFNRDLSVASFGNYIKVASVSPVDGQIIVQAEADTNTLHSPFSGLQLVSTSSSQQFGVNFLGNTTDSVAPGQPVGPVITSQTPTTSVINVLTNHVVTTPLSVALSASSAIPISYQWYKGTTPIAGATTANYTNIDTNNATLYCVITNLAGSVTSSPVSIVTFQKPTPSAYQSAIFAYNPVAYWPLVETNGTVAFDYASTNDGTYTGNVVLGQVGLPPTAGIGANTSVAFNGINTFVNIPVNNLNITNAVTVIAWVQQATAQSTNFAGILGHGDSSYRLTSSFGRSDFADPGPDVVASVANINDGSWHQIVGVYDGTLQHLYVDGTEIGTPTTGAPAGNMGNVWIGGAPDYTGTRNINANIAQVAIVPSALTSNQVVAVFNALDTPPKISLTPVNPAIYSGFSQLLTASAGGAPPITYQWYYIDNSSISNVIVGATNSNYNIINASSSQSGYGYGVIASNPYGTSVASTTLMVADSPTYSPLGQGLYPYAAEAYVGASVTYTANAAGSAPIYYQWLVDGSVVSSATNASFTLPADCGIHSVQVIFTNSFSAGSPASSQVVTLQSDASPTNITFNTDGTGWYIYNNGAGSPSIADNLLTLTTGVANEACAVWNYTAQYVGNFKASFTYQGVGGADGACFILQNDPRGLGAAGGTSGSLGYSGIASSLALQINLFNGSGRTVGIALATNGNTGTYSATDPVNVGSGNPINVTVSGANGLIAVTLKDTVTLATFATNYNVGSLTSVLGGANVAYVGFSGSDHNITSVQTVTNFVFSSVIPPMALSVSPVSGNTFNISWSAADPNYVLQTSSSLTSPSWGGSLTPVQVGNNYRVNVNVSGSGQQYYRLIRVVSCP